jgi:hypothetical protein
LRRAAVASARWQDAPRVQERAQMLLRAQRSLCVPAAVLQEQAPRPVW